MIAIADRPTEQRDWLLSECERLKQALEDSRDTIQALGLEIGGLKQLSEDLVVENKRLKPLAEVALAREEWERDLIDWMLGYADPETSVTKDIELEQGVLIGERDGRRFELELSGSCTIREVDSRG